MPERETSTEQGLLVKRVTVRSGGAGHAHSGIVKGDFAEGGRAKSRKRTDGKLVSLGG